MGSPRAPVRPSPSLTLTATKMTELAQPEKTPAEKTPAEIENEHWMAIESLRDIESDETWEHLGRLRKIASPAVVTKSLDWCSDPDPFRRSIGISVLAQLGSHGKLYPDEATSIIRQMVSTEADVEVITSLISAVSFREVVDLIPWLVRLADHEAEDIRWRIAWALPIDPNPHDSHYDASIEVLLRLSRDTEPRVRDWATFSLATQIEEDSARIRDALLARVDDADFDTRSEAMVGLARCRDPRGIPPLIDALGSDRVGELAVEAAEAYADPQLQPSLLKLKKWWDINPELLERAIAACS